MNESVLQSAFMQPLLVAVQNDVIVVVFIFVVTSRTALVTFTNISLIPMRRLKDVVFDS